MSTYKYLYGSRVGAMAEIFACSRGFLIERQPDGRYTPFFVKVRRQDIIDDDGSGEAADSVSPSSTNAIKEKEGWLVHLVNAEYFTATKTINVTSNLFTRGLNGSELLSSIITLPYEVTAEEYFCSDVGINGLNDKLATSVVNIIPQLSNGRVHGIKLSIRNVLSPFPDTWTNDSSYSASKLYVRVSGK